jgi:cytochrome c biogenesis protein CcmG, thiol:disulfide interchange protein DsbE
MILRTLCVLIIFSTNVFAATPKKGETLPSFEVQTLSGEKLQSGSLKGKVIFINFWATWCAPCVAEFPSIIKLWKKYHSKGLEVVAITNDEEPKTAVPPFVEKLKVPFKIYMDPGEKVSNQFGIKSLPISIIADKKGKVQMVVNGDEDWMSPKIQAQIEKML